MQILHLDLKEVAGDYVELRYFLDNPNQYQKRQLPLSEISHFLNLAEQDYYVRLAEDYAKTGQKLYKWLDGSDRFFQRLLNQHQRDGIVLAIATAENLAHLPWEVLHDGNSFLVQRIPGVVPVRWLSSDEVKKLTIEATPENRALNLLFMATSPLKVEPILDFEAEEGRILEATARQPLFLAVEESGCLSELGYLIENYGKGYFDVFHLTGHANLTDAGARFVTETEIGEAYYATAEDIARELQFQMPKLIFLSGCRTGQALKVGAVPSMAEELLKLGGKAILGWGQKVLDSEAKEAAATLYQELAAGKQVTEAVACTYQTLIKIKARDWHLLRLYAAESLPGNLVTPLRTRGRKPAPPASVATEFLDTAGKVKVPKRESFVGRRRQLQSCLRALTQSPEEVGVLIHGMGGLGKSSLAARLSDRLPDFERVVWVGRIDEASLVNRLAQKLDSKELREAVQDFDEELKFRLKRVFNQSPPLGNGSNQNAPLGKGGWGDLPFLLVLDDFEDKNLEPRDNEYVLKPEAARVLEALVWAIQETNSPHRLIITSRYDFDSTQLRYFYKQPLDALQGADLRKKCDRLAAFSGEVKVDEALQSQAKRLADGNPRLLEWLDKVLGNSAKSGTSGAGLELLTIENVSEILTKMEGKRIDLREEVLDKALLELMDEPMQEMLSRGLVFELPIPKAALTAVCDSIPNLEGQINRAVALGLLEVSPDASLRVPRILPLKLPENGESLNRLAAEELYRLWWEESKTSTEERCLEIHRLALQGKLEKIAVEIGNVISRHWINTSQFNRVVKLCQDTLKITENYQIFLQLARSKKEVGEIDEAIINYHHSLNLCNPEDEKTKAAILHNLAEIHTQQGEVEKALTFFNQSLEITERIGDIKGQAATLHDLAIIYANQRQFEKAIAYLQKVIKIDEYADNLRGKATALNSIASIYGNQGQYEKAIDSLQQSLALQERVGNIQGQISTLHNLASIYDSQGKSEDALNIFKIVLEIEDQICDINAKAATLNNIAFIYDNQGKSEEALVHLKLSFDITKQIKDINGQVKTLTNMAFINAKCGQIGEAFLLYQQLLELQELIDDVQGKAGTLGMLGQLLAIQGDFSKALDYLSKSLEIFHHFQSPEAEKVRQYIARVQQLADSK
ncbi:tetratricopeptide repeat protein [Floridanema aerugineum]|uniref:Tetratricopeptide repeat protein n=1 Tax=Floridaenema aerugineum BLCC-F46 TaxID=3153654 RepID=A0ABV4XBM3_9CYAN